MPLATELSRVHGSLTETIEDLGDLPSHILRLAQNEDAWMIAEAAADQTDWILTGHEVTCIAWRKQRVEMDIVLQVESRNGICRLHVPLRCFADAATSDFTVRVSGEILSSDEVKDDLIAALDKLALPQAVTATRNFYGFEKGELLVLDMPNARYVRPSDLGLVDARNLRVEVVLMRADIFDQVAHWPL